MKNYSFYAVIDHNGVCNISHDKYEYLKAVFSSKEEADRVLLDNKNIPLKVVEVSIRNVDPRGNHATNGKA